MAKKPFKETKVGKFLKDKGGDLLDTAGSLITGNWVDAAGQIKDLITNSDKLDPEQKEIALKYLEQDLEAMKLDLEDRKDARNREVQINNSEYSSWLTKNITSLIAIFVLLTCTAMMLLIGLGYFEDTESTIRTQTWCENITLIVLTYYFSSTLKSREKDSTIAKLSK
jgi:hypothetical protein